MRVMRGQVFVSTSDMGESARQETQVTVVFPKNPIVRESVTRYIEAVKSAYIRVADGRSTVAPLRNVVRQPAYQI
jgi:hypothetical protein